MSPGVPMARCRVLGRRIDGGRNERVVKYVERLPRRLGVPMLRSATDEPSPRSFGLPTEYLDERL